MKKFDDLCKSIGKGIKARNAIFDGEVVAIGEDGLPVFSDLLRRKGHIAYFAFDLLWLNDQDLGDLPLLERKKMLRSILPQRSSYIGYVSFVDSRARRLFELVKEKDLEGLVAKRKDGKYRPETRWYKVLNPGYSQKVGRLEFFQRN